MSDEEPVGIRVGEWFFGILMLVIGFIVFYFAFTSYSTLSDIARALPVLVPGIFLGFGGLLMVVGVVLLVARHE